MDFVTEFAKEILINDISDENVKKQIVYEIENGFHNDLMIIDTNNLWIKKEEIKQLQKEFNNKSIIGNKRVYIINNADKLNIYSSNSILKFLEEPENNIIAILITENKYNLLDTIISRCVNINLNGNVNLNKEKKLTKEKIASYIFNNEKEQKEFLEKEETDFLIETVFQFVNCYENNKQETILYLNKVWHKKISSRAEMLIAFEILIMFYRELLNIYLNKEIEIFNEYQDEIKTMCNKNTIIEINNKITIVIEMKKKIKYNMNSKLLMDQLILKLGD